MSLVSTAPFSNVTTYRKDFYKRECKRPPKAQPKSELKNPVTGPLQELILPRFKYRKLNKCLKAKHYDPEAYAQQVAENYPSTRIFLRDPPGGPPDFDIIDKLYENDNRTTYMISYCVLGDYDSKEKRDRSTRTLPEGWELQQTTYKCSYRHPLIMAPEGVAKLIIGPPRDNLIANIKERDAIGLTTGETIYQSDISNIGDEIIKGKLHGDVNIRPYFDPGDLFKAKLIRTT